MSGGKADVFGTSGVRAGERRFWMLLWLLSLLVIACTYLTPFFFEWIPLTIFIRDAQGIANWSFSADRFWRSSVAPHCFFSGYILSMLLAVGDGVVRRPQQILAVTSGTFLYLLSLELLQVLIPGRTISGGDVLIHLIAYSAGALLGFLLYYCVGYTDKGMHFPLKCLGVWVFVLVYLSIYPISLKTDGNRSLLNRFLFASREIPSKSDVLANFLLGWPSAWLYLEAVGTRSDRKLTPAKSVQTVVCVLAIVFFTALFVETIQHFFAERYPSFYDILLQVLGAASVCWIFMRFRANRIGIHLQLLEALGRLTSRSVALIAFSIGFLVFEWTPWFPSIEVSTIKDGVRELVLPFVTSNYPWDLHWEANRLGIAFVFACSAATGIFWYMLLRSNRNRIRSSMTLMAIAPFYGLAVELGKVLISTKNVTPLLVLSCFLAGLLVFIGILVLENREKKVWENSNSGVDP